MSRWQTADLEHAAADGTLQARKEVVQDSAGREAVVHG